MTKRQSPGGRRVTESAPDTITVPRSIAGVAASITHAGAAHETMGPARSLQSNRQRPPAVAFGDTYSIPDAVANATPATGIEVRLPSSLRSVFVTAPLAFYLGATVTVAPDADPVLRAPDHGVVWPLDDPPTAVPAVLSRVFWLDCLVREATTDGPSATETALLDDLDLDPARLAAASPAGRLAAYLETPFERVADRVPDWHLGMHVAPTYEHATTLPYLLDRLALVFPPETASLERQELVSRSLDDFYRGAPGPVASVEMVDPVDRPGRMQGWLADGIPVDAFKSHPASYRNHDEYQRDADRDAISVAVVLNDRDMAGEHDAVADIYESRAGDLPIDVTLHERLTRTELTEVLTTHHEFVHYIGHCAVDGLRCADGHVSVADLPALNVETFFLNACGSFHEGLALVEGGSVAGAVTLRKVLDAQAAKVGTAFARLLLAGFPIALALRLARRRIRMGKDYAVVGDGTQTLAVTDDRETGVAHVDAVDGGDQYRVAWTDHSMANHGGGTPTPLLAGGNRRLGGNQVTFTASATELARTLPRVDAPVVLDGQFYWADEAAAVVRPAQQNCGDFD
ncbi:MULTISPECIES: CHAT domain-containing protein [Halobacterium]|uniref:CHAT domain-containing protein n=1 Tax=Halobacterium TaxID=2239 RepID=UPI001966649D|nr:MULTISPECIES: CHAT domain-containing protein [Halobacterium]MCF2165241.1 hypothetical protein [Halobacterium salinarum]MCF2167950.1 hypothetical protein [Halobacterium salinarum]MDL0122353.1 hypothetical protein [Halobacterium salinarum]MDL0140517.1 hypothetical protein [Halobacterium salinarum]QRY21792.1 hypothetical protein JT689_07080 [Halobacterium sp. GSL-19]